jgi:hypothetical protein
MPRAGNEQPYPLRAVTSVSISCGEKPSFVIIPRLKRVSTYLRGTYIDDLDAPMPGVPWTTFLLVMMNSPM